MSIQHMKYLDQLTDEQLADFTAPELTILRMLAWRMWKGVCNPSVNTLARQTRMKITTVRKALNGLKSKGWIKPKSKNRLGITSWDLCFAAPQNTAPHETRAEKGPSHPTEPGPNWSPTRAQLVPKPGPKWAPNREREVNKYPEAAKMPSGKPGKSLAQVMTEAGLTPIPGITPA